MKKKLLIAALVATFSIVPPAIVKSNMGDKKHEPNVTTTPSPIATPTATPTPTPASPGVQTAPKSKPKAPAPSYGGNSGIAILERIKQCESGGNYTAQNRSSTASGAYQFLDSTWAGYGGYSRAMHAPPAVQDQKARETYARSGTRPWAASQHCWGR